MEKEKILEILNQKTILFVEDDPTSVKIILRILKRAFKDVLVANDGEEGLKLFQDKKDAIDIVLTDIDMPVMNGIEMAKRIKAESENEPIIFISAFQDDMNKNVDLVDGIIEKPVIRDSMFKIIYNVIEKKDKN